LLKANYIIYEWDSHRYLESGKNLVTGQGFTSPSGKAGLWFPPFYPLLIGIFYKMIGRLELAGHLVSVSAFLISIVLFFRLAKLIYNASTAYVTVILFATHGLILEYSHKVYTHSVDILLIIGALYAAVSISKAKSLRYGNFILLGTILSCAILNRPENIILSLALLTALFIQSREKLSKKALAFICLAVMFCIILFPYAHFLYKHTGRWALTYKMVNLKYFGYLTSREPLAAEKTFFSDYYPGFSILEYIQENKAELLQRYAGGMRLLSERLTYSLYGGFGYILILIGFFGQKWDEDKKKTQLLLFSSLSFLAVVPFSDVKARYFIFTMPVFLLWTASGLERLFTFMKNNLKLSRKDLFWIISAALILLFFSTLNFLITQKNNAKETLPFEYKEIGLWMKNNIRDIEDKKISSRESLITFYSQGQWLYMPFVENYAQMINRLKEEKVDYLIIDERTIPQRRPHLAFLLNENQEHPGLIKVHVIEKPKKIILYALD
jgi:4-amino-4-deoxy-L-arabinose transferase-like glycosyltransferase